MPRIVSSTYILVLFILIVALSCQKGNQDPITKSEVPSIELKSIRKFHIPDQGSVGRRERDSVAITVSFQDSDDDLGEFLAIDSARYKAVFANQSWGNYQIKILLLLNGQYWDINSDQYTKLYYPSALNSKLFFPRFKYSSLPFSFDSAAHTLTYNIIYPSSTTNNRLQTIPTKYQIKIRDRKLNESNVIETDTLHLQYLLK